MNTSVVANGVSESVRTALTGWDARYTESVGMVSSVWKGPGYHSRVPNGTQVHQTRDAFDYALLLLAEGSAPRLQRAATVLRALLPLQQTNPCEPTYGIWPWLQEESLEQMSPPDWNWADFCGVRLAHILGCYRDRLEAADAALVPQVEAALGHAARSVFRRNVGPGYTNIAIKGAIVCIAAGELLEDAFLQAYGQTRLERIIAYSDAHGGYNEYNSPNYGLLVLSELERGLLLIRSAQARAALEHLHAFTWRQFAYCFNPGTGQLCGPQSRAYQDLLPSAFADAMEAEAGIAVFRCRDESASAPRLGSEVLIPPVAAPADVRAIIGKNGQGPLQHRQFFIRSASEAENRIATLWHEKDACIGSMNTGTFWVQQRAVLGYLRDGDNVAVLRVRMLHDGKDFASGALRTAQEQGRLLSIATLADDKGDFHDHLDRPKDGTFTVGDLMLSIELNVADAAAAGVRENADGSYLLFTGDKGIRLSPVFSQFDALPVRWRVRTQAGSPLYGEAGAVLSVEALINEGKRFDLIPAELEAAAVAFGLELVSLPDAAEPEPSGAVRFSHSVQEGRLEVRAPAANGGDLCVTAPLKPCKTPYFHG